MIELFRNLRMKRSHFTPRWILI